ncbi:MAG: FHA domain-containing protein [Burkholderiaceae bacterium]|nr:FHA domain-containing protein [Burkholderiaceae bacterium]
MPRMIVSIDGVAIKEVPLTKTRTTLGRRPYNDIVIDNLAVSGEHAVFHMVGHEVEIEDLGSTNGTFVNTIAVRRQALHSGDTIGVGKYNIRFMQDVEGMGAHHPDTASTPSSGAATASAAAASRGAVASATAPLAPPLTLSPAPPFAIVRVLSGAAAGREVSLQKVVTTLGKAGTAVASITRRHQGYVLAHVEGLEMPLLNGTAITATPVPLKHGDRLQLAGTEMQFEQA